MRAHFTLGKKLCPLFTDFSADARSEIWNHLGGDIHWFQKFHLMDICFSLPRSIPAIAEKRTRKIAGTHSSKFVFYVLSSLLQSHASNAARVNQPQVKLAMTISRFQRVAATRSAKSSWASATRTPSFLRTGPPCRISPARYRQSWPRAERDDLSGQELGTGSTRSPWSQCSRRLGNLVSSISHLCDCAHRPSYCLNNCLYRGTSCGQSSKKVHDWVLEGYQWPIW